jgi:peptide/nickel transport system ATP-binding protein
MTVASIPKTQLLNIENLAVEFRTRSGIVKALDQVSFSVAAGETVGLVGESGSGKSVLSLAILGILDAAARITAGTIAFEGDNLLTMPRSQLRAKRGTGIAMIFQNPRVALNPIRRIGQQLRDVLIAHGGLTKAQCQTRALELLTQVRIPDPHQRINAYPYELSGGMCQRVMIALALAGRPKVLIADEPTTGLDVTTQAAVMELIRDLGREGQMGTILITHDLDLAAQYCDRILVMHAGHIVETAPTRLILTQPRHPYTAKLLAATPDPHKRLDELTPIAGHLPDLRGTLPPCRFQSRCDRAIPDCDRAPLKRQAIAPDHTVACWHPLPLSSGVES